MASTYSPLLRLELIAAGEQAGLWGNTTNSNLGTLLEQAIAGATSVALTGASPTTYTLSQTNGTPDESRAAVLIISGAPSAATTIVVPALQKTYIAKNATTQTLTFKTTSQVGGVAVVSGGAVPIFCDGTNVFSSIEKLQIAQGGTGATTAADARTALDVPSRTGAGASGTWAINISGAAGSVNSVPVGGIIMWSGSVASIPAGWALCNGLNGTPDLRNRFIVGAGSTYNPGNVGGSADSIVVAHSHTMSLSGNTGGQSANHTHGVNDPGHAHVTNVPTKPGLGTDAHAMLIGSPATITTQSISSDTRGTNVTLQTNNVDHTHAVSLSGNSGSVGASGVGANLPPYYALCYIMLTSGA